MDFEEAWREAVMEEQTGGSASQTAASSVQHSTKGAVSSALAEDKDPYDDFSDEELLQLVPFANDSAPDTSALPIGVPVGFPASMATSLESAPPTRTLAQTGLTPATTAPAASFNTSTQRAKKKASPPCGVLDFPPIRAASFMLRGDDGRVKWVTTTAGNTHSVSSRQRARSAHTLRKRKRSPVNVVEVLDDDEDEDGAKGGADVVVEVDSSTSASASASEVGDGTSDAEDASASDADEAAADDALDEAHNAVPNFLRDGVNVRDLLRKIHADDAKRQAEAQESHEAHAAPLPGHPSDPFLPADEPAAPLHRAPPSTTPRLQRTTTSTSGELWVTKYSPKLFREVLSDESINLRLLQWLKSWDAYVFPEASSTAGGGASSAPSSHRGAAAGAKDGIAALVSASSTAASAATAAPPEERIAVLTGPPGVGKTTLVHVLAAHCGYEVIEVNASVERTASRLEALIKTAVSAAGPAPGGRLRRAPPPSPASSTAVHGGASEDALRGGSGGATSLVQHLLRPKCLVIDEMDGIASSSVAAYLVQLQLHRPVFCLCNDLYVPSLRPLRQRCSHIYHLPPIRPQRLLSRLEEIARCENVTALDQMALSSLITTSGGDVRSCLNTMQFINSVITQQASSPTSKSVADGGGTSGAAPSRRHTIHELIRRMQGKDSRLALKESWQLLFTRPERSKAVQMLKQECGIDYEEMVEAAAAQHARRHIVETRRRQERERVVGQPSFGGTSSFVRGDECSGGSGGPPSQKDVAFGFRVDPGYLYAAHQLLRCPDTVGLVDGLQENYLDRAYTDYSFNRTAATADGFSRQDVTMTAAFQQPAMMMGAAERLNVVSALNCYVHCSTAARGGRIEFPREQATLKRLHAEARHVGQQFRSGCRPQLCAFLGGEEVTSTDLAPMLLRSLFDRALRLPAHALTSFSRLPQADQRLLQAAVARHVEYGLTYEKDRHYVPPASSGGGRFGFFGSASGEGDVPWRLTPELDRLLAGVVRPMEAALLGGYRNSSGGSGGAAFAHHPRFADRNGTGAAAAGGVGGGASGSSYSAGGGFEGKRAAAASSSARTSLASVLMPLKNEVRQILVGEIRQYRILQSLEILKQQQQRHSASAAAAAPGDAAPPTKRARADGDAETTTGAAADARPPGTSPATTTSSSSAVQHHQGSPEAAAAAAKPEGDDGAPDVKRVKQEGAAAGEAAASAAARPAVRRDFFGRPLADPPTAPRRGGVSGGGGASRTPPPPASSSTTPPSSSGTGGGARGAAAAPHVPSTQACVRYIYQDGSTNAVKMPAVLADF